MRSEAGKRTARAQGEAMRFLRGSAGFRVESAAVCGLSRPLSTFCYTARPPGPRAAGAGGATRGACMLEERLEQDMKTSLKAGHQTRLATLRMMRSQLLLEKKKSTTKQTLTDDEVSAVIGAYAKKLRESAAEYEKLGRPDEAGKIREELGTVQEYLPQPLTESEARELVQQVLTELSITSPKDFGRAMKEAQARARGRADGKLLSELVRAALS